MGPIWAWLSLLFPLPGLCNMAYLAPKKDRNRSTVGAQDEEVTYFPEK